MPADPCPTCHGIGELEGGRGEPPRVDCPTCCWRLSDLTDQGLDRGLVLLHPRTAVTWWRSLRAYAVTGATGRTELGIDPADLPTVLAAHGCRMPSDAALAWVRGC